MVYHQHGCGRWREVLLETLGHYAQLAQVLLPEGKIPVGEVAQAAVVADSTVPGRALPLHWSSLLFL